MRSNLFALVLLLASCQKQNSWQLSSIRTGTKHFDSSKLVYRPQDPIHGMELEIISLPELQLYLNTFFLHFPSPIATINFTTPTETLSCPAHTLQGNQRLRMDPAHIPKILEFLLKHPEVTIRCANLEQPIHTTQMQKKLKQLKRQLPSFLPNKPLSLPL